MAVLCINPLNDDVSDSLLNVRCQAKEARKTKNSLLQWAEETDNESSVVGQKQRQGVVQLAKETGNESREAGPRKKQ